MPNISRLLETALYVDDVERSARFYEQLFGFRRLAGAVAGTGERVFQPLEVPGGQVLLLFLKGSCTKTAVFPGGTIPPHDGNGHLHVAFAISAADLADWRERLQSQGIAVEGEMTWPRGSTSLYFRDPDGHVLELATPGLWPIY